MSLITDKVREIMHIPNQNIPARLSSFEFAAIFFKISLASLAGLDIAGRSFGGLSFNLSLESRCVRAQVWQTTYPLALDSRLNREIEPQE